MEYLPLGNQIRELEARIFKDCSKLRELSLSYNSITRIDSEAFRNVGDTMESLEISFGLKMKAFPGKLEMHSIKKVLTLFKSCSSDQPS